MKTDLHCQRQRCNPLNVLFYIMFLAFICRIGAFVHALLSCAFFLALARLSLVSCNPYRSRRYTGVGLPFLQLFWKGALAKKVQKQHYTV